MSAQKCWFVYYDDFSGFAIFHNELAAYKYAAGKNMFVAEVKDGDLKEQL